MDTKVLQECHNMLSKQTDFKEIKEINGFNLSVCNDIFLIKGQLFKDIEVYDSYIWDEDKIIEIQSSTLSSVKTLEQKNENEKIIKSTLNTSTEFYNLGDFVKVEKIYRQINDSNTLYFSQITKEHTNNIEPESLIRDGWTMMKLSKNENRVDIVFMFKYELDIAECFHNIIGLKGLESILNISRV